MVYSTATEDIGISLSESAITLDVPERKDADTLYKFFGRSLAASAEKLGKDKLLIRYPDRKRPIQIPSILNKRGKTSMTSTITATPEIAVSEMMLSLPFLRVLGQMLEKPEEKATIVRVADERQIVVSASLAPLITSATPEEATRRKREDYWHLPHLTDFRRDWRQYLEPNNPESTREISFACCDPITRGSWRRLTNRYRAIEVNGQVYHYSVNLGSEAIVSPI